MSECIVCYHANHTKDLTSEETAMVMLARLHRGHTATSFYRGLCFHHRRWVDESIKHMARVAATR
jgi:hypothetical protein